MMGSVIDIEVDDKSAHHYSRLIVLKNEPVINRDVLERVALQCAENFEQGIEPSRSFWASMESFLGSYLEEKQDPDLESGVSVFGPVVCDYVQLPKKDDEVVIAKGACIKSTSPNVGPGGRELKRNQRVTVNRVGGAFFYDGRDIQVENPTVHWAGSGGYWCWTSIDSIQSNGPLQKMHPSIESESPEP